MQKNVCLIVPCFNEAHRLDLPAFEKATATPGLWIVFVDDGSTDGTAALVRGHCSERIYLVQLERNSGKAEAVRQGMLRAATLPFFAGLDWIGYWDADLSTPVWEIPNFLRYQAFCGVDADAIIGSRVARLGSDIRRSLLRHAVSRVFVTVASLWLGIKAYDSQCGAKLIRPTLVTRCFGDPFVTRWLFDIEILLRLGEASVLEYPLKSWHDVGGSKLKLLPSLWRTPRDLFRVKRTYGRKTAGHAGSSGGD